MKPKMIGKITVDLGMTILLMLLMAFELIGRTAHEWIGAGMFVLFILHHILNRKWTGNLLHGRYTPYRILQTVSAGLVFLAMIGLMVSAVLISREVFTFLPIRSGRSLGRMLHMICSYWGFLLFSFHLGIHWKDIDNGEQPGEAVTAAMFQTMRDALAEQKQTPLSIDDVTAMVVGQIGQLAPMDEEAADLFQKLAKKMMEQTRK